MYLSERQTQEVLSVRLTQGFECLMRHLFWIILVTMSAATRRKAPAADEPVIVVGGQQTAIVLSPSLCLSLSFDKVSIFLNTTVFKQRFIQLRRSVAKNKKLRMTITLVSRDCVKLTADVIYSVAHGILFH